MAVNGTHVDPTGSPSWGRAPGGTFIAYYPAPAGGTTRPQLTYGQNLTVSAPAPHRLSLDTWGTTTELLERNAARLGKLPAADVD